MLTTVNNKSDFNLDDPEWAKVFEQLNQYRPLNNHRDKTEAELKRRWVAMLKATDPDDEVSDAISVWSTATKIDVCRRTTDGVIFIAPLEEMAKRMNELTPPHSSLPYNFKIARLRDKAL